MLCKAVTHSDHQVETIEDGIKRLKPISNRNIAALQKRYEKYSQELKRIEKCTKDVHEGVTRVKEEAELQKKWAIRQAEDDYKNIVAEVEKLEFKDETYINEEATKIRTEMESIKRTSDWTQTLMESAHAASLLNELQSGPSQRLVQNLPAELPQLNERVLVAPRIGFQRNQQLNSWHFGNLVGCVTQKRA